MRQGPRCSAQRALVVPQHGRTCSRASRVRARCPKISMMSPTLSSTGSPQAASRLRCCTPLRAALTYTLQQRGSRSQRQQQHCRMGSGVWGSNRASGKRTGAAPRRPAAEGPASGQRGEQHQPPESKASACCPLCGLLLSMLHKMQALTAHGIGSPGAPWPHNSPLRAGHDGAVVDGVHLALAEIGRWGGGEPRGVAHLDVWARRACAPQRQAVAALVGWYSTFEEKARIRKWIWPAQPRGRGLPGAAGSLQSARRAVPLPLPMSDSARRRDSPSWCSGRLLGWTTSSGVKAGCCPGCTAAPLPNCRSETS